MDYTWVGFGSQTTVVNLGLGSRTIAITPWRSESSNISLVVLDNILYYSRNLFFFKKLQKRRTDGQHLLIKSPRRRLKRDGLIGNQGSSSEDLRLCWSNTYRKVQIIGAGPSNQQLEVHVLVVFHWLNPCSLFLGYLSSVNWTSEFLGSVYGLHDRMVVLIPILPCYMAFYGIPKKDP